MDGESTRQLPEPDFPQRWSRWDSIQAADQSSWGKWARRDSAELWVAVALFVGLDPDSLEETGEQAIRTIDRYRRETEFDPSWPFDRYLEALDLAQRACAEEQISVLATAADPRRHLVRFDAVDQWGLKSIQVIEGWPPAGSWLEARRMPSNDASSQSLIQQMLGAASSFRAVAAGRGEVVTNAEVQRFLAVKFPDSSLSAREVVATDTRPANQKRGRPRRPKK